MRCAIWHGAEESNSRSNDGKLKVDQVAAAIRTLTAEPAEVKALIEEMNQGSQDQASGIEQIGEAVARLEQVTLKAAASAEENTSAAAELNAQSGILKDIVGRLTPWWAAE